MRVFVMALLFSLQAFPESEPDAPKPRVSEVEFSGHSAVPFSELRQQLLHTSPRRLLPGWKIRPEYNPRGLEADVHRLQSYLIARGFLDAKVQSEPVVADQGDARVRLNVTSGPSYSIDIDGKPASPGWSREVCKCLMDKRSAAERLGSIDFQATLRVEKTAPSQGRISIDALAGPRYQVGRIEFRGNHRLTDRTLRNLIVLDEGALFDSGLLRKSLTRMVDSGLIEDLDENSVRLRTAAQTGIADVVIHVKEVKHGRWSLSGPMGPMSFAGPLQASISARLPSWGRGWFDLATYSLSASVMTTAGMPAWGLKSAILPVVAFGRPYSPVEGWRSGWQISPSYGWQFATQNYVSTQAQSRLMPFLTGTRTPGPPLPVEVAREGGPAFLLCEEPKPKLASIRSRLPILVQAVSAIASF